MKKITAPSILLIILYCSGCTMFSIRDIQKVKFTQGTNLDVKKPSMSVLVTEKRYSGQESIIKSKPGQEIVNDMTLIDQYFKRKGIKQVYVRISLEDIEGDCPSCGMALFMWPEIRTANIQVEWAIREKPDSEYAYKIINSKKIGSKKYSQLFLLPYGIGKLIWNLATGEWDSELGFGKNLFGITEFEKAAAKLNKVMVKEIIDNNFEILESEPKLSN